MVGSSRYNGPGAALRNQPRAPRQRSRPGDDSSSVISNDYPVDSSPSVSTVPSLLTLLWLVLLSPLSLLFDLQTKRLILFLF